MLYPVAASDELDAAVRLVVAATDERHVRQSSDVPVDERDEFLVGHPPEERLEPPLNSCGRWRFVAVIVSPSAVARLPTIGSAVWAVLDSRSRTQEL